MIIAGKQGWLRDIGFTKLIKQSIKMLLNVYYNIFKKIYCVFLAGMLRLSMSLRDGPVV